MLSVHITTDVSSNPSHGDVLSIQHYVLKFVSDLRQVGGFLRVRRFPPPIKLTSRYYWNIVESGVKHHKPPTTNNFWCKNGNKSTEAASYYQLWKDILNSIDQQIH